MRAEPQCSTISIKVFWIILGCVISIILRQARAAHKLVMYPRVHVMNGFTGTARFCLSATRDMMTLRKQLARNRQPQADKSWLAAC